MCGICGIVGKFDEDALKNMTKSIIHRGPDSEGFYLDADIGLGIRRLKVIDLNTGDQPIHNEDKTIWIVFNGEIYNFKELRDSLVKKGHIFYTQTDTEVVVHLYEEYRDECVKYLRGMFAFAIWDKNDKRLLLARDRVGIKPLYYSFINNRLIFGSEIKSLLQDNNVSHRLNFTALDKYLTFLYIPAPLTIFEDIFKLLPGHILSFRNAKLEIKKYWQLEFRLKENSEDNYIEEIKENLKEIVKLHMISDVPLGALLSGGLDSSTIVGLMSQVLNNPVETFSIGFEDRFSSYNELQYSDIIAKLFQTKHHQFIVKPDIIKILPTIVSYFDEPFADSSAILNYLICQEARKFVTVALSGIGGDEVFGGYPRYLGVLTARYYNSLPLIFRGALSGIANLIPESRKSGNITGRIKRYLKTGVFPLEERYIHWISYFNSEMKNELYSNNFKELLKDENSFAIHQKHLQEIASLEPMNKISYLDIHTYLPDDLLIMADRMSMANSLELRVPFCDHKLIELLSSISFNEKLKGFKLKSLFRKTIKDLLPSEILNKRKQGFMVPLADWLREDLREFVFEVLSEDNIKKRKFFNPKAVNSLIKNHFNGTQVNTHQIWALFILELWCRKFL
ncbi:MAG: asparagine synthase (glutamine-hydrolyzing) [Candidatus Omnitrophota bacterium]|nr:asparagine synthase (glutamine-hydrolyzing) [Candidatus Omnitrophota bacterium]